MTGIEVAVGCLIAWVARKATRVGVRADTEVDQVLDAGMDKLHELITDKLGSDPALAKLRAEVERDATVTTRTRDRVRLAVEDAADSDPEFAARMDSLVARIQQAEAATALAGSHGTAVAGDVTIQADDGSAAAWRMGDVSFGGGDRSDPQRPGRSTR